MNEQDLVVRCLYTKFMSRTKDKKTTEEGAYRSMWNYEVYIKFTILNDLAQNP